MKLASISILLHFIREGEMKASTLLAWILRGRRSGQGDPYSSTNEGEEGKEGNDVYNGKKSQSSSSERLVEELGVTRDLKEFVKGFTVETFKQFPCPQPRDVGVESYNGSHSNLVKEPNVRNDLSDWQERHATLVLTTVKEIAKLRYILCPRQLKENEFWRIYFSLVKSYTAQYEIRAIQKEKLKRMELGQEKSVETIAYEVEMTEARQAPHTSFNMEDDL